jgi:hypothetical protein
MTEANMIETNAAPEAAGERQEIPRPEYPRPQFVREQWMNLNGTTDAHLLHGAVASCRARRRRAGLARARL